MNKVVLVLPVAGLLLLGLLQPTTVSSGVAPLTFTVDDPGEQFVEPDGACPSPCTLREAVEEANFNSGANDTILFDLPSPASIFLGFALFIDDGVTIDGTNLDPTSPGRVELTGNFNDDGIIIVGGTGSVIRDLVLNGFFAAIEISGDDVDDPETSGNKIAGCRIGTNKAGTAALPNETGIELFDTTGNTIGGTTAADRNLISGNFNIGIELDNAEFNVIRGNRIGTNATGTAPIPNGDGGSPFETGILLDEASDNIIGGKSANARNLVSGNNSNGINLLDGDRNLIEGNYIGVNVNGTVALPNNEIGVFVDLDSARNTIGGTVSGARNVISGHSNPGIFVEGDLNVISGNYIGTNAAGTAALPNDVGVIIEQTGALNTVGGPSSGARNVISGNEFEGIVNDGAQNVIQGNYIGVAANGTTPLGNGEDGIDIGNAGGNHDILGNVIRHNGLDGIEVEFDVSNDGNAILGNSIFANGRRGIDLEEPGGVVGVTPNDPDDVDTGLSNDGQNFPFILRAVGAAKAITIDGSLNSTPSTTFRLEFFANPHCDNSGHGEGRDFLGGTEVTTNSGGDVVFSVTFLEAVPAGQDVTATATSPGDDTSEFSACRDVVASGLTCQGMAADIAGTIAENNLTGTDGDDVIAGSSGDDTISALGGDDRACGGTGDDTASGGDGLDRLNGESGDDTLNGDAGDDVLNGGGNTDTCNGGDGTGDTATNCETTTGLP